MPTTFTDEEIKEIKDKIEELRAMTARLPLILD